MIYRNIVVTILASQVYTDPPSRKVTSLAKNQVQNTFGGLLESICIVSLVGVHILKLFVVPTIARCFFFHLRN